MLSDFQRFYGLKADKVIDKDPERAAYLISGLTQTPASLYRARKFTDHPPDIKAESSRYLGWYEWGPQMAVLTQILNTLMLQAGGKEASGKTLKGPHEKRGRARTRPT